MAEKKAAKKEEAQPYEAVVSENVSADKDLPTPPVTDADATNVAAPDATLPPVAPDSYSPPVDGHSTGNLVGNEAPPAGVADPVNHADWQAQEAKNIEEARKKAGITDAGAVVDDFAEKNRQSNEEK